jgi:endonuclease/exonuclease/phosphatase family metal-dependent hydrolase
MVRLICYNIEYCEGMEGIWYQYLQFWKIFFPPKKLDQKIIQKIKRLKPDILALVEVDTGSFRSHKKDEVVYFEKKLGLHSFVEMIKYPFQGWLKLFHFIPILNRQANAIVSRYKLVDIRYHLFHEGTKRMVIEATINCPKKVTLLLAHLALGYDTRKRQIEELVKIVNSIRNPVILMGDFNTFHGVVELETLMNRTHLKDKAKLDEHSMGYTEPAWHPMKRLDYVLVSPQIKVKSYEVLNFHFSDHMPLMVDFEIKNGSAKL